MFGFLPNNLFTGHRDANTTGLSPRLWGRVSGSMMASDGSKRLVLAGDDFLCPTNSDTYTRLYSKMNYTSYIDTSGTLLGSGTEKAGVLAMYHTNTDNKETWLQSGDAASVLGAISDVAANAHLTAFECRFKVNSVVDDVNAIFLGLAEEATVAENAKVDDTGVMVNKDYIGFDSVHTNGGTAGTNAILRWVYKKSGQTAATKIATLQTMVADTWYKVGFVYDPNAPTAKRITCYLDNVKQSTYITGTNIATATFPDGEEMGFLAGIKSGTGTAGYLYLDWWAYAQLI
jgi:hypothetical protein